MWWMALTVSVIKKTIWKDLLDEGIKVRACSWHTSTVLFFLPVFSAGGEVLLPDPVETWTWQPCHTIPPFFHPVTTSSQPPPSGWQLIELPHYCQISLGLPQNLTVTPLRHQHHSASHHFSVPSDALRVPVESDITDKWGIKLSLKSELCEFSLKTTLLGRNIKPLEENVEQRTAYRDVSILYSPSPILFQIF